MERLGFGLDRFRIVFILFIMIILMIFINSSATSTIRLPNLTIRACRPSYSSGEEGWTSRGDHDFSFHASWKSPFGSKRTDLHTDGSRLWVDMRDYGNVRDGDLIQLYYGRVYINDIEREPAPATESRPMPVSDVSPRGGR